MPTKKKQKRNKKRSLSSLIIIIVLIILAFLYSQFADKLGLPNFFGDVKKYPTEATPVPEGEEALFHIIDIGQGDAILVMTSEGNMLIDTGDQGAEEELRSYLKSAGVTSFKYVVFTHPDSDHIGNADHVIQEYTIEKIIMPDVVSTSKIYERMMTEIAKREQIEVIIAQPEYEFTLGALHNVIIAPNDNYNDTNEMSVVIKSTFGDTSIMLTGDAEKKSEADIIEIWDEEMLDCDVLKIGHHGSATSTTDAFLDKVSPSIAVISCGLDNKYGHPLPQTIQRLEERGIKIYRTDMHGSIVLKTDGKEFTVISPTE